MGLFTKPIKTLNDLFVHMLQDIYYAENQITKTMPTMIEKASEASLKQALQEHLGETRTQISRLEQVFRQHGEPVKAVTCAAMDGIIAEAKEVMGDVEDQHVLDAAILASSQAVEHYEITRYGTLIALARQLGRADCAELLAQNLAEEKAADHRLTEVADARVNRLAA